MLIAITISESVLLQAVATIFAAGGLYAEMRNIRKVLDGFKDHPERLTKVETEVQNIKEQIQ